MTMPNDYPPFSVLMSVYKSDNPNYLDFALKSIEQQTVKPNEIVLVEDGPISQELHEVIKKHTKLFEGNFKNIRLKTNNGLGVALKVGTKYISNQWIARMDSDDYSVPDRFEKQLKIITSQSDISAVGGQVAEFVTNINNVIGYRKVPVEKGLISDFIKWRSPINHPTVMLNKKSLINAGGYLPYGNLEDYFLWARMLSKNMKLYNSNDVLVHMRVDDGMYERRGKLKNIKFFYALRSFMYRNSLINLKEMILGDFIVTVNIIIPGWLRKIIYQRVLHK
ncbi:glycosyltransferase [Limosilactobacillus walteri]|uniref:Glycosyltransferase n=1 Tax=Limosilactobacillus walteri TaxID=2268022 RepID=A0ABR8P8U0_9LACO|nr:glycosyltransferase [Limosilactobacillus walteri]MBD5807106.1 glycosyltransferase [Limosilactobacillus walteri]